MSQPTFYFYDLETTGFNPREARIMQFAGQRTTLDLEPVEEPHNYYIRLTEDILPDPDAILLTGITPQKTLADGISEAEFLSLFHQDIARPGTIFVGFNTIRFDDEFMRFLHYRNFYDPYEWQWQDGRSRWDLLDVVRMTRALRPEGIKWPFDSNGQPSNRLELLTIANKLDHSNAHDALSDVNASIAVAKLIRAKQPKLFDFLLTLREKKKVAEFINTNQLFLYTSGKYQGEFEKTTAGAIIAKHPARQGMLVYDLRYDPEEFFGLTPKALTEAWRRRADDPGVRLPVKTLQFNHCPAVAPLSVLDEASQLRLELPLDQIRKNYKKLTSQPDFTEHLLAALKILDEQQTSTLLDESNVDARLYDGFFDDQDRSKMRLVRTTKPNELSTLDVEFSDERLSALLPLYKARNYPKVLNDKDRAIWEKFKEHKLLGGNTESWIARYFARLKELRTRTDLSDNARYLLEELELYGQSIL
ncbi:exodeoxyribonuclease I [Candidatus Saccharibacteria bacterium]|nr:exodeoxyribonuclease I [Candidatus Saccharibacteria bacterium]MBI3338370.1 exodeoxyribonuclease I [Candidatus Saccharibacteria bacterium]